MQFGRSAGRPFVEPNQNYEFQFIVDRNAPQTFCDTPAPLPGPGLATPRPAGRDFQCLGNFYDLKSQYNCRLYHANG